MKVFIKRKIAKCLDQCVRPLFPLLFLVYKYINPSIIVMVDGGICSQMRQYLLAKVFIDKGFHVEFDLSFFKYGADMNGEQVRNFDLQRAFPYLPIKRSSHFKRYVYKNLFSYIGSYPIDDSETWTKLTPPAIMLGYYVEPDWLYSNLNIIFKVDSSVLDPENLKIYNNIPKNSVAIHIRRGDLANVKDGNYGPPVSEKYLLDSISYMDNRLNSPIFYIFSDGMDYVKERIIPYLDKDIKYQLVNNGSDKGYCDLFLISKCSHQITSKGTLGKFGACLNKERGIVIVAKDEKQLGPLLNADKEIFRL